MRARLLAIFWWGIVFLAVYELLITRQVGQVFKTEWCNPPFLENIGIMDVSIIKQCNHMMLSFDNQVYDTVLYGARSRAAIVRVQIPPHSIFDGLIKANEMLGSLKYGISKAVWQFPVVFGRVITIFDGDVISGGLTTICDIEGKFVIHQMLWGRAEWPEGVEGARIATEEYISRDTDISAQLTLCRFDCVVGRSFCFIRNTLCFGGESVRSFNRVSRINPSTSSFPSLPAREASNEHRSNGKPARGVGEIARPFNKFVLMEGIVVIVLGWALMGKAFETLFFLDERRHGWPIIIFSFVTAIGCAAFGAFWIVEMT